MAAKTLTDIRETIETAITGAHAVTAKQLRIFLFLKFRISK